MSKTSAMSAFVIGCALFLFPLPLAAQASKTDTLFQSHFAALAGGEPCYARAYSSEHLKAHPEQRVSEIELDMAKENPDGIQITEDAIELGFGIRLKGKPRWYTNVALCKSEGTRISCFLEGDGGAFTLTAAGDGLRLVTGDYGIAIEGAEEFVELSGAQGDDRVFILQPADKAVCARSSEDLKE